MEETRESIENRVMPFVGFFFFQAEDGIRDYKVTGVQTCALPISLPFKGRWLVGRGGVTPRTSHSWLFIGQRYAYDFVAIDPQGKRHRGTPTRKEDYLSYGQPRFLLRCMSAPPIRGGYSRRSGAGRAGIPHGRVPR